MKKFFLKVQKNPDVLAVGMVAMFLLGIAPVVGPMIAKAGDSVAGMIPGFRPKLGDSTQLAGLKR